MLMSPNYPLGFPEDELMTWQFVVPSNMRASVFFHDYSLSNCERKEERVEYYIPGSVSNPEVFKLSDSQPANIAGSFNLSLQGCDQDAQNPGILRLLFQVVVQHPQIDESEYWFVPSASLCIHYFFLLQTQPGSVAFVHRHLVWAPRGREECFRHSFFWTLSPPLVKEVACWAELRPALLYLPLATVTGRWMAILSFAICSRVKMSIVGFILYLVNGDSFPFPACTPCNWEMPLRSVISDLALLINKIKHRAAFPWGCVLSIGIQSNYLARTFLIKLSRPVCHLTVSCQRFCSIPTLSSSVLYLSSLYLFTNSKSSFVYIYCITSRKPDREKTLHSVNHLYLCSTLESKESF